MRHWRSSSLAAGAALALVLAVPVLGQADPQSILPPDFGEPKAPPPTPAPAPASPPREAPAKATPSPPRRPPTPRPAAPVKPLSEEERAILAELEALYEAPPPPVEIPDEARRPVETVGILNPEDGGLAAEGWGNSHGRYLSALMRRTDAPLPSRWAHIALRRALLSPLASPRGVHPVDWVAERAWLLLRMGEADGARLLVQAVDVDRFTPKMYDVAVQTGLATADPAALCPLVEGGRAQRGQHRIWPAANAMCATLGGEGPRAASEIGRAGRGKGALRGIDLLLAEKVVGAGRSTRRAVTIDWEGVDRLTAWRFGLASATGLSIPPTLFAGANPQVRAWAARAPLLPMEERLAHARYAAALGVYSNSGLVQLYSQAADAIDVSELENSEPGRLGLAYRGSAGARLAALRRFWSAPGSERERYGNLVLTGTAAALFRPSRDIEADGVNFIASMFAAGHDRPTARWRAWGEALDGANGDRAWAMSALGTPGEATESRSRVGSFIASDQSADKVRSKLLVAALAGLGRLDEGVRNSLGEDLGVSFGRRTAFTVEITRAAASREAASVMLLGATGLQAESWTGVSPINLYHVLRALSAIGEDYTARMIAAEALTRT